ncbi:MULTISPECIES: reverse transcriptase domain-containing protein [Enterobacteriaceae]|uniref:RNA-directed DNA polymerase n=1 Tax=Salmonella enterica TaxID=28901 RepID=A0A750HWH1_SALER|nr:MULTISPECIES: reverse transcriptase domain-containing protein [Enterobacteriaceae]ECD3658127.1 RNA-directed DNA polymerase [Salmonella enterica subsp. enterica]EFP3401834.1 RNA-directed DNA polymerase [Salmonella enterica]ELQ7825068.1 RNA-directed DNA polymerase [Enterobacter ludwigii]EHE6148153.1 RNA-directed DNA polymerase [Salmonella enterica]EKA4219948.1 RNA-directed DNA polymerase [Escherichia coli]
MSIKIKEIFDIYFNNTMDFVDFFSLNKMDYLETKTFRGREIVAYKEGFNKLRLLHRFLNEAIFNRVKIIDDVVFSYRKKVNVFDCVYPHRLNPFIFKTDIKSFFPSFTRIFIQSKLENIFKEFIISDINEYLPKIVDLVSYNDCLPVGFSTSPSLSNILFSDADKKLKEFSASNEYIYTRYSDDLIISSEKEIHKNEIFSSIQQIINSECETFVLNFDKTKLLKKGGVRKIMGVSILPDGHISVDKAIKNNIETKLHYISKLNNVNSQDPELMEVKRYLSGMINYISTIDEAYINKLKRKYGSTIVEMFLRKSLVK